MSSIDRCKVVACAVALGVVLLCLDAGMPWATQGQTDVRGTVPTRTPVAAISPSPTQYATTLSTSIPTTAMSATLSAVASATPQGYPLSTLTRDSTPLVEITALPELTRTDIVPTDTERARPLATIGQTPRQTLTQPIATDTDENIAPAVVDTRAGDTGPDAALVVNATTPSRESTRPSSISIQPSKEPASDTLSVSGHEVGARRTDSVSAWWCLGPLLVICGIAGVRFAHGG